MRQCPEEPDLEADIAIIAILASEATWPSWAARTDRAVSDSAGYRRVMRHGSSSHDSSSPHTLARVIDQVAQLLPAQGPISIFIHHNTLHAFEHLPFEEAVETRSEE